MVIPIETVLLAAAAIGFGLLLIRWAITARQERRHYQEMIAQEEAELRRLLGCDQCDVR